MSAACPRRATSLPTPASQNIPAPTAPAALACAPIRRPRDETAAVAPRLSCAPPPATLRSAARFHPVARRPAAHGLRSASSPARRARAHGSRREFLTPAIGSRALSPVPARTQTALRIAPRATCVGGLLQTAAPPARSRAPRPHQDRPGLPRNRARLRVIQGAPPSRRLGPWR